ncbi:hypothetical protein [Paraburkholderia azotifigens]|uniref:hypothetical protein n=1 Tax=Paraburkholderia azotifigens TaxID=2057004 RepID=UPI0038BA2F21
MSAPFSNCRFRECDLPGQCRDEGKCHHPAVAAANGAELRKVPAEIIVAIQAYGDARADNVEAVSQLVNLITLIRASYTAPIADSAMAKDAPGNCHKCGLPMSVNPHPEAGKPPHYLNVGCPWECIPCLVKSRHSWAQQAMRDRRYAERYRHLRDCNSGSLVIVQIIGTGDDDQVVLTEEDADFAIDAAIAASAEKGDNA